jgi:hypothetical protein
MMAPVVLGDDEQTRVEAALERLDALTRASDAALSRQYIGDQSVKASERLFEVEARLEGINSEIDRDQSGFVADIEPRLLDGSHERYGGVTRDADDAGRDRDDSGRGR